MSTGTMQSRSLRRPSASPVTFAVKITSAWNRAVLKALGYQIHGKYAIVISGGGSP